MRKNFLGIPKDPLGFSNNAKMKFGPPKYEDAKFTIADKPVVQNIKIAKFKFK